MLVNDFGAVNVDAALIAQSGGDMVALANGCLCCTIGDDLGDALARLAARGPEHVVIEASGVGDPWRIAQLALIEPGFSLEPIVVLADATALQAQLDDRWIADTVRQQLAHAEILFIAKSDLADAAPIEALLAGLRPGVPIRRMVEGRIDAADLVFPVAPRPRASRMVADAPHPFRAWHWQPAGPVDRARLRGVLERLPAGVLRVKGILDDAGGGRMLLQFAAGRWAITATGAPVTGLVAIGTPEMAALDGLFAGALAC